MPPARLGILIAAIAVGTGPMALPKLIPRRLPRMRAPNPEKMARAKAAYLNAMTIELAKQGQEGATL